MMGRHFLIADIMYRNAPPRLINVHALVVKSEQLVILQQLPPLLVMSRLVNLARDFNCTKGALSKPDATRSARRYTWSLPDGSINSRIDFLFVSQMFSVRSTDIKAVFFSDHCLLLAVIYRLYDTKPTDSAASQSFLSCVMEVLDDKTWERLDQPLSLDELIKSLKSLEKNKSPMGNGLPAELYLALWDLIAQDQEMYDIMLLAGIITLIYKQKK
eukprot:g32744.t1